MIILNLLHQKTKYKISSINDVGFSELELFKIVNTFITKNKIEIALNKTLKEIIKNIDIIPNYDSYLCYLFSLYEEYDLHCNINLIKNFIHGSSKIERLGVPSYSYIWAIKYAVIDTPNNNGNKVIRSHEITPEFWYSLADIVCPKLKYLCEFALIKHNRIALSFEQIKKILCENNSKIIFHDLQSLKITDEEYVNNVIEKIKNENGKLWTKIKSETINERGNTNTDIIKN